MTEWLGRGDRFQITGPLRLFCPQPLDVSPCDFHHPALSTWVVAGGLLTVWEEPKVRGHGQLPLTGGDCTSQGSCKECVQANPAESVCAQILPQTTPLPGPQLSPPRHCLGTCSGWWVGVRRPEGVRQGGETRGSECCGAAEVGPGGLPGGGGRAWPGPASLRLLSGP